MSLLLSLILLTLPQTKPEASTPTPEVVAAESQTDVAVDNSKLKADLQSKAEKGDATAAFDLASVYHEEKNEKFIEWIIKAAKLGNTDAEYMYGFMLSDGIGVPKNEEEGFNYTLKAAKKGHPHAQTTIGDEYYLGTRVKKDDQEALRWYQLAAEQNDPAALNNIGSFYLNGRGGLKKDEQKSMHCFVRAAYLNSPLAQNTIAINYGNGQGVEKNLPEAFAWMWLAASGDDSNAQENILELTKELTHEELLQGQKRILEITKCISDGKPELPIRPKTVVQDDHSAQKLTEEFQSHLSKAQKGDAQAQYQVATAYALGKGVEQNLKEAFPWCQKAAEQGLAIAQYSLAATYRVGDDFVKADPQEAFRWYKKAAEQKHPDSIYAVALCYEAGEGVEKDEAKSLVYYREAADLGHPLAQFNLANYYFKRADKEPSSRELMFKYYTLAAKQMHARSMLALGVSYLMDPSPNKVEGLAWMMVAVQCFAYKMDIVEKFKADESPEDIGKARERAAQIISELMKQK